LLLAPLAAALREDGFDAAEFGLDLNTYGHSRPK
jgi:hypothetical protein